MHSLRSLALALPLLALLPVAADEPTRTYSNRLVLLKNPAPLFADHPNYVEPIRAAARFEAPALVEDKGADLHVRAWRFSYNARGIIEMPNQLRASRTAVIVVHPWGVDDGQGWKSPEPAGVAFGCTPEKNQVYLRHMKELLNPFLKRLRGQVGLVAYSLPGNEDPIRQKLYRSIRARPSDRDRQEGQQELTAKLKNFDYHAQPVPEKITVASERPVVDYFRQFHGLDSSARYNNEGFWKLPIPVAKPIEVQPDDVVIYDAESYSPLKGFLQKQGIRHVLLTGYCTDLCVKSTTAGYVNLARDFNVFLVGDGTLATFPAHDTPRFATSTALAFAAQDLLITQASWVRSEKEKRGK